MTPRTLLHDLIYSVVGRRLTGVTLVRANGAVSRIRGDLIPVGTVVVVYSLFSKDVPYVRTDELDEAGFRVYREGYATFRYNPNGG